jgi:2-oxoglutarate ferredoxin oxidoreductase subunit beta
MTKIFGKTKLLTDEVMHYCPGCCHGIVHRLVAEAIDELGVQDKTVGVVPVGCAVFAYKYFNVDTQEAAHGRAPAVATGIKRVYPQNVVFTYQGDGDLASIGTAEIVHAAHRGEKITAIFINNAIYGMTGGQMAPTTLVGQKTTTSPYGRDKDHCGSPIRMSEMLATIEGSAYSERVALNNNANIIRAKKAIKKAFETQIAGKGFSMVEVLSTCPTNWGKSPIEAMEWLEENMIPYYPLGVIRRFEPCWNRIYLRASADRAFCLWASFWLTRECWRTRKFPGCPPMDPKCAAALPTAAL